MKKMTFKKLAPGRYMTSDGAFTITRVQSQQTGRRTEICWEVIARPSNQHVSFCQETLRDAKQLVKGYY